MFNEKYYTPLELFGAPHLIALGITLAFILLIFFLRKFFIKYSLLDKLFRYTIVGIMVFFEMFLLYREGFYSVFNKFITPDALCTHMLWIAAIAMLANSTRLMKLIFPLAITGSCLSLIVAGVEATFPHFRAFQFFITHIGFLVGALYFVFTKKINHYTLKDLAHSCLLLCGMSVFNLVLSYAKGIDDPYFIITPPAGLESAKEVLGQVGYSTLFVLLIASVQFAIYGITHLCTRHRKDSQYNQPQVHDNKIIATLAKLTVIQRLFIIGITISTSIFNVVMIKYTNSNFLNVLDIIFTLITISVLVIDEVIVNYNRQQTHKDIDNAMLNDILK